MVPTIAMDPPSSTLLLLDRATIMLSNINIFELTHQIVDLCSALCFVPLSQIETQPAKILLTSMVVVRVLIVVVGIIICNTPL